MIDEIAEGSTRLGDTAIHRLVSASARSLLDAALPPHDLAALETILDQFRSTEINFGQPRTRESGRYRFVALQLAVRGDWTIRRRYRHDCRDASCDVRRHVRQSRRSEV